MEVVVSGGTGFVGRAITLQLLAAGHQVRVLTRDAAWFKDGSGDNVVRITSNSWGGGRKSRTLETSIKGSGALFVASAGNSGSSRTQYPAGYTCDNVISVAATDHDDALASFSNYGDKWVDLGAPGVDVLSCVPGDGYESHGGTSMAAPHVSGVAAMIMANNPDCSLDTVKSQIMDTGDSLSSLSGKTVSGKRLNAWSAVGGIGLDPDTTAPSSVTDLTAGNPTYTSLELSWSAPGDDDDTGTAWLYDIRYSTSTITTSPDGEVVREIKQAGAQRKPGRVGAWLGGDQHLHPSTNTILSLNFITQLSFSETTQVSNRKSMDCFCS